MECNLARTSAILIRSVADSAEQIIPILNTEIRHFWKLCVPHKCCISVLFVLVGFSWNSWRRGGSTISSRLSDNAFLTYLWRSRPSLNMSSVGLFPVNISSRRMPKLYTSPNVETSLPIPYSAVQIYPYQIASNTNTSRWKNYLMG